MRILIIDDHPFIRKGLLYILQREIDGGCTVDESDNQSEAMALLAAHRYDLVLLDISLGGRNGLDILAGIRKEYPDVPVLIISMHPEDQYALRAFKLGAAGYLTKHSAPAELMTALGQITTTGRYISPTVSLLLANEVERRRPSGEMPHEQLSNREMEIACLIAGGSAAKEIAASLNLSVKTIATYRARLLHKLGIRNNVELTAYFINNKLIS